MLWYIEILLLAPLETEGLLLTELALILTLSLANFVGLGYPPGGLNKDYRANSLDLKVFV